MDRRMCKRVALAAGLFFLACIVAAVFLSDMAKARYEEEARAMAALTRSVPEEEATFAGIITGKGTPDATGAEEGKALLEKYGYTLEDSIEKRRLWMFAGIMAVILATVFLAEGVLGWYFVKGRRKAEDRADYLEGCLEQERNRNAKIEEKILKEEQDTKALITDVTHQLKTPIASLKMSYEIEDSTDLSEEERAEFVRKEREDVRRMENLLQAFTQMTRLETGMIQLNAKMKSLKETLKHAVGSVYMKALQKEIRVEMEECPDLVICHDPKWTAEAFANVLDNGVKYSPSGSRISIRVSEMVSYVMVEIEDEGIGIPKEERQKIFQRFYRGGSRGVQEAEGYGVGLYLTRWILEQQKGTIFVKPGKSEGSNFVMTLPKE